MFFSNQDKKFQKILEEFFKMTANVNVSIEELEDTSIFFQSESVQKLIDFGSEHPDKLPQIVQELAKLEQMDVYRGCLCGFLIGLYAENGVTDQKTDDVMIKYFVKLLHLCFDYLHKAVEQLGITEEDLEEAEEDPAAILNQVDRQSLLLQSPQAVKAWQGISIFTQGLMSRISANRWMRDQLRIVDGVTAACEALDGYRQTVGFVPWILNMAEEETALLLVPQRGKGVEVRMEQIDSNNVLFTLAQFALYHRNLLEPFGAQDFTYDEVLERIAKHEPVDQEEWPEQLYDRGCFGYYTYEALQEDGSYDEMKIAWGEGTIYDLPKLDGQFVLLLTEPIIKRSWGNAFVSSTHPGLKPYVEILRELSPDEVNEWLEKIAAKFPPKKIEAIEEDAMEMETEKEEGMENRS